MSGVSPENKVSVRLKNPGKPFTPFGGLDPLRQDDVNGVVFPYTPTIQMSHSASYGQYDVVQSVYQQQYYVNTPNPTINVTAQFTSDTEEDAKYTAAALHFFKACTKSDFGDAAGDLAGTPPPVLLFNAYGIIHGKNVPVVLQSFSYTLTEDVDYVEVDFAGERVSLPTMMLFSLDFRVQMPPSKVREEFDIRRYANGFLMSGGNKGGFI